MKENIPTGLIDAPVFIAQGESDDLVVPDVQKQYVVDRCQSGQRIEYKTYPGTTSRAPLNEWNWGSPWYAHIGALPNFNSAGGFTSEAENSAPNGGDGNADGIADNEQDYVYSFLDTITGKWVTIVVPEGITINNVSTHNESDLGNDSAYSYPGGLIRFTLNNTGIGASVPVTIIFHDTTGSFNARKFNATTNSYSSISGATFTTATIG